MGKEGTKHPSTLKMGSAAMHDFDALQVVTAQPLRHECFLLLMRGMCGLVRRKN